LKQEVDYNNINLPPFPSLRRTSPRSFSRKQDGDGALNAHVHGRVITAVSSGPEKESSIRGGNLFKSVFSSGGNNNSSHDRKLLQDHHRRHQSMDALDVPLRKGIGKDSSVSLSPKHTFLAAEEQHHGSRAQTPENATQALAQLNTPRQIGDKDDDDASSLDDLLASAASTPSSQHMVVSLGGAQRTQSLGGLPQYMMNDAIGLSPGRWSAGTARPLYPRSSSYGYNVYRQDAHQYQNHFGIYNHQSISEDDVNLQMPIILPPPLGTHRYTLSEASENVGLTLDDSDNSHADENSLSRALENDGLALESSTLLRDSMGSQDFVANSGLILSSPYQGVQPTEDIKKVFTNFHNASHYARDSTTAYLGGRNSSVMNLAGAHDSHVSYHATLMRSAGGSLAYSGGTMSDRDVMLTSPPTLATVDEYGLSIHTDMRLLKPIQGTDAWQPGRRYLIAPAALSACPLPSINKLLGSLVRSASEACTSSNLKGFGTVNLGDALMTYIGEKHHLSLGKWSSSKLVLRQNYLFEYHTTTPINGLPRGYVHLQYAVAYKHLDFPDVLELKFYGSPCAKSDHRTLRIKVKNHIERDYWITCLNKAANLNIEDIWEIDQDNCLGVGRYATVLPARRKTNLSDESNSCALKVIDKNEFWRRVVKGRERADTLVRELAVQATLTAKCSQTVPTFLQLRGFFESSDKIVIELELLEGTDLFHHIQSMGSLCEEEAAHIIQDVLTSLDSMNRNGLAHRDIKPANILVSDRSKSGASVKLCDFGMSTFVGVDGLVRGRCGTPGYVAPEILTAGTRAGYGNQVDVFSAGVTLYLMLSGVEPFYGESEEELVADNTRCEITFPNKYWGQISEPAKDLVCQMMQADPSKRVTAKGALQHPWLLEMVEKQAHIEGVASSADIPEEGVCTLM
jgi:calcium/calmodulin-dependent protein kinase I